ncbi:hypothetical protein CR513_57685, partial [Mucuna pruriens]
MTKEYRQRGVSREDEFTEFLKKAWARLVPHEVNYIHVSQPLNYGDDGLRGNDSENGDDGNESDIPHISSSNIDVEGDFDDNIDIEVCERRPIKPNSLNTRAITCVFGDKDDSYDLLPRILTEVHTYVVLLKSRVPMLSPLLEMITIIEQVAIFVIDNSKSFRVRKDVTHYTLKKIIRKKLQLKDDKIVGFLQVRGIFIHCVVSPHWWCLIGGTVLPSHHQKGDLFHIRVVSELSGLKGVLLARIMEKPESMSDEEWDFEHQQ